MGEGKAQLGEPKSEEGVSWTLEPQRLRVQKRKTQGRPDLACGRKQGEALESPLEVYSPSPPTLSEEQAHTWCCGLQHVFEKLGRLSISTETSSHV